MQRPAEPNALTHATTRLSVTGRAESQLSWRGDAQISLPGGNDAFSWLDSGMLLAYMAATTLLVGGGIWLCLRTAAILAGLPWSRLAMALIPLGGINVFVGLSRLTTGQLFQENIALAWANPLRMSLLTAAALWSFTLAWRIGRAPAAIGVALAAALPLWAGYQQCYVW